MSTFSRFRKMSVALAAMSVAALLCAPEASAAAKAPQPLVSTAQITVQPQGDGGNVVTENLALTKVNTAKGHQLAFVLASYPGETVSNLTMESASGPIHFTMTKGDALSNVSASIPDGVTDLELTVKYTVTSSGDSRVPIMVPMYTPSGSVKLTFALPPSMHLHSSNPRFIGPDQGPVQESLSGIPSFVTFTYGPSSLFMNADDVIGLVNVLLILAAIWFWLAYERRRAGGVSSV